MSERIISTIIGIFTLLAMVLLLAFVVFMFIENVMDGKISGKECIEKANMDQKITEDEALRCCIDSGYSVPHCYDKIKGVKK